MSSADWANAVTTSIVSSPGGSPSVILGRDRLVFVPLGGTINKLVPDRGFGFIAAEDGKEYFFPVEDFDTLMVGEKVSFEIEPEPENLGRIEFKSAANRAWDDRSALRRSMIIQMKAKKAPQGR